MAMGASAIPPRLTVTARASYLAPSSPGLSRPGSLLPPLGGRLGLAAPLPLSPGVWGVGGVGVCLCVLGSALVHEDDVDEKSPL